MKKVNKKQKVLAGSFLFFCFSSAFLNNSFVNSLRKDFKNGNALDFCLNFNRLGGNIMYIMKISQFS